MLTSKRLVMLVASFVVLVMAYMGYARSYVGAIDGLPALPERYRKGDPGAESTVTPHPATREAKIKQAFGEDCPELSRPFRLEVRTQGMVLSSGTPQLQDDGTVRLEPVSIALFGKQRANTPMVEINTVRGDVAVLTFEHPVKNESDIGASKVTRATLEGNILVVNNRSTPDRGDDLTLAVPKGPLVFNDAEHTLTTDDDVHVTDWQSKPRPVEVFGTGMRVDLIADSPPPKGPSAHAARNKNEPIRGVKRVTLNSDVRMYLFAEGKNNFLGGAQPAKDAKAAKRDKEAADAVEKDQIIIRTNGPFRYDLEKDHDFARFDAPPETANVPEPNRQVFVQRIHVTPKGASDQMRCQVLELRLHRKDSSKEAAAQPAPVATGPRPDQGMDRGLDIEWARATGDPVPGRLVTMKSDTESLVEAEGTEFIYEIPPQPVGGPSLTTLSGTRQRAMRAVSRDGTIITAVQVKVKDHKGAHEGRAPGQQEGEATGPGVVDFIDKKDPKNVKIQHAWFRDRLISDRDDGKDRMTLIGNARFVDEGPANDPAVGPTTLEADVLKVWLDVPEPEAPRPENATPAHEPDEDDPDDEAPAAPAPGRRPHHLEAIGKVNAHSKDLNIHDTGRLVVRFKDVPVSELPPPPQKSTAPASKPTDTTTPPVAVQVAPTDPANPQPAPSESAPATNTGAALPNTTGAAAANAAGPAPVAPTSGKAPGATEPEPARPLDLSARNVEVLVFRSTERNQVKEVHCAGDVHVHQAPDPNHPEDKGVDILGDSLDTLYKPEGQYLLVKGDLAQLLLDKIYIVAPEVHIDQAANKAWAYCPGAMTIESTTNFNGEALASPELLTVHWGESMLVFGDYAEFHGNVLADQKSPKAKQEDDPTSRMACDALQLFFDRPISLKGESRSEPQPKVRNLVCDRNVQIEQITLEEILDKEGKFDHYGKLIKKQYLACIGLTESALEVEGGAPPPKPAPVASTGPNAAKPAPSGNEVNASGPGLVRSFGPGGDDALGDSGASQPESKTRPGDASRSEKKTRPGDASRSENKAQPAENKARPAPAPKKSSEEAETKLTTIEFRSRMYANNQSKTAMFWGGVRVLDLPSKDPDQKVDIDAVLTNMPQGSLYLNCAHLTVLDRGEPGKPKREMRAAGRALVQGPDFWGRAETVTYNEEKDQLIFDGGETGQAILVRIGARGAVPKADLHGKKITYIKSTGDYKIDGGTWMSGKSQ